MIHVIYIEPMYGSSYFTIQATEKYSAAMYYIRLTFRQAKLQAIRGLEGAKTVKITWRLCLLDIDNSSSLPLMMKMSLTKMMAIKTTGCTQIPISTLSHIWVFVRLYGIVYVIIVILLLIIIMII